MTFPPSGFHCSLGRACRHVRLWLAVLWLGALALPGQAQEQPEYRLKAAFLYNFAVFAEWPAEIGPTLQLCLHGADPFGAEIEPLQGKKVGERMLNLQRRVPAEGLRACHLVFVGSSTLDQAPRLLELLRGMPVLIVADTPGALQRGAALNLMMSEGRVSFEANLKAARAARLGLSSRLLRLATEVLQ